MPGIPSQPAPVAVPGGTNLSVDATFKQLGLWRWYASPITNYWNGATEKGQDYSTNFGAPVGVPVGGKVVRITHNNNSIGDIVEVMDTRGAVWLYQHINSKVSVGQSLKTGDVVGTENGLPVDQYSTGPHIEVRYARPGTWNSGIDSWNEPWTNPMSVFGAIGGQQADTIAPTIAGSFFGPGGNPLTQGCNLLDIGCWAVKFGEAIGIFVLAVVLIVFGLVLMNAKPIEKIGKVAAKVGVMA